VSNLEIAYGPNWSSIFLAGLPPRDVSEKQWQALSELARLHAASGTAFTNSPAHHPGGWSITARPGDFEKLHSIAAAILAHQYGPLAEYRAKETP
jgi:hypothetical protein